MTRRTVIGCYGLDRLVCVDDGKVYETVGAITPADGRDVIVVVANSTSSEPSEANVRELQKAVSPSCCAARA